MEFFDQSNMSAIMGLTKINHSDAYPFVDPMRANLQGKSVFITGASKGIGRAIAIAFAETGCSHIAIAARGSLVEAEAEVIDAAVKARGIKPNILSIKMDVTSDEDVKNAATKISERFGTLDILVNNAGYTNPPAKIGDINADTADWWKVWEINVKGVCLTSHYLLPLVLKSESKTVVNVISAAAYLFSGVAAGYGCFKVAVYRYTKHLHVLYAREGLLAHNLNPGASFTDQSKNVHVDFQVAR